MTCSRFGYVFGNEVFESKIHLVQLFLRRNNNCLIKLVKYGLELILLMHTVLHAHEDLLVDSFLQIHENTEGHGAK